MFNTINHETRAEITIKKSRFIAEVFYTESQSEAEEIIQKIRKREHSAKHHCFGYRILEDNLIQRMSDDGEPSGTAGTPILTVLQGKELINTLVVVTRYFGGTLLGTGGLVRAYSEVTTEALLKAEIKKIQRGAELKIEVSYADFEELKHYINTIGGKINLSEYSDNVENIVEIPISYIDNFTFNYQKIPFEVKKCKIIKEKFVDI